MPIIVSTSDDFTDLKLSSRRIIIYGAGAYCMRLLRTMESSHTFKLSSIACIIDGNPKKQGAELEYAGKRFPICSPDVLRSLDPSSHVVIISSRKYTDRMMETILQTIPSSPMPVIADCYRIFRSRYDTVEELLASNPISQDGLRHSEWCKDESTVLHLFHSTFEHVHGEIKADFFFPIPGGMNSLLIGYEVNGEPFVFRVQRINLKTGGEYFKGNPSLATELINTVAEAGIGKELLVYQDHQGCRIERYASPLTSADIEADGFMPDALAQLRKLHAIETPYPFKASILECWCNLHVKSLTKLFPWHAEKLLELHSIFRELFSKYQKLPFKPCICHGEPQLTNIVRYKGSLVLIDWDCITVDDPLFDVCTLLFSTMMRRWWPEEMPYGEIQKSFYDSLDETLRYYYERPCTELEHTRAELVAKGIEIHKLMESLALTGKLDADRYDTVVSSCSNVVAF